MIIKNKLIKEKRKPFRYFYNKTDVSYDASAQALFDQWVTLGTPASVTRKTQVDNIIVDLKAAGIWELLDYFYVWTTHSQTAAIVDWKNPTTRSATVVNDYVGAFVTDSWFKGNGSNFRIDLNFNPADGGTYNFTQNNNSFGVYIAEHIIEAKSDFGNWTTGNIGNDLFTSGVLNSQSATNNSGTLRSVTGIGSGKGLSSVRRTASNSWKISKNGYDNYSGGAGQTDASQALNNLDFQEFCRNTNGTYTQFTTRKHCYSFAGSGGFDHFTLHNIIDEYLLNPLGLTPSKRVIFNGNSFNSSISARTIADINNYNGVEFLIRGLSGNTTVQINNDAVNTVFNKQKNFLDTEILWFWELTNDFFNVNSNVSLAYTHLTDYLTAARAAFPNAIIITSTCMPRAESASFINANRQNDLNLLDDTTLNGKIRNHLVQDGFCDALADPASDPIMGIYSQGVAGVGEKNTTYYNVDEIHPNTTGYNYLADNYVYPIINSYL